MQANLATVSKVKIDELPNETKAVLQLLEQVENHTASLRNKLMEELKSNTDAVRLKLDNI